MREKIFTGNFAFFKKMIDTPFITIIIGRNCIQNVSRETSATTHRHNF